MLTRQLRLAGFGLAAPLGGAAATLIAAYASVRLGAQIGIVVVLVLAIYLGTLAAYLAVPHLAVAGTIALFAVVPALIALVHPAIGSVKDIVSVAAISAAVVILAFERRRPDRWVGFLVALLLGLYLLNVGHSHNLAWAQGVRLTAEPLLLLLAGFILPNPRRNLRYAVGALVVVGCLVALYGLLQQAVGGARLVSWGYTYTTQVRTIGGRLRSFGTFDDPFGYAAFLLFAIAAVIFWLRRGAVAWGAGALLVVGLAASYVRTGLLVGIALGALLMIRWRYTTAVMFLVAGTAIVAGVTLVNAGGTQSQSFNVYASGGNVRLISRPTPSSNSLVLNGRISAWQAALGKDPGAWLFGRGVGKVGTAAARASRSLIPSSQTIKTQTQVQAVDSGYFATIADVGLVGLVVLLALLGRLAMLGVDYARRGIDAGWVALALLSCMLLDALTRASFTGFPTAFIGLFVIGIALAAGRAEYGRSGSHSPS